MSNLLQLPVRSEAQLKQLNQKNALLDVLGNVGQQIAVVGDTSVGKSTVINFLLGYPINFEASGIGTRRPCVISQVCDPANDGDVRFIISFCKAGEIISESSSDMGVVAQHISNLNNPAKYPQFFPCIKKDPSLDKPPHYPGAFDDTPINVQMRHKDFKDGLRLIDLPGLTRNYDQPMQIARKFIKPKNIIILILGRDNRENAGWPDLAEQMSACEQVIFLQNFATEQLPFLKDNYQFIKKTLGSKGNKLADRVKLYCTDFGRPKSIDPGLWREGLDQEDWKANTDGVHDRMWAHAVMWAKKLKEENSKIIIPEEGIDAGIGPVLKELTDFQFADMGTQLQELKDEVHKQIKQNRLRLDDLGQDLRDLESPPEWQAIIAHTAKAISEFLDTTTAIPSKDDAVTQVERELAESLKTTNAELDPSDGFWCNDDLDKMVRQKLADYSNFEQDTPLACLRSWFRLLNEFSGMCAFMPMPLIEEDARHDAFNRIGEGKYTAGVNPMDALVQVVLLVTKASDTIRSLLTQFKIRATKLMVRDVSNALKLVRQDHTREIADFLRVVDKETEEEKQALVDKIEKVIHQHIEETLQRTIDGEFEGDDQFSALGRKKIKEKSGLRVREDENNAMPGFVHWLLPFKFFYLNGQIPWKDLRLGDDIASLASQRPREEFEESVPEDGSKEMGDLQDEIPPPGQSSSSAEILTNAMNLVNLKIYKFCSRNVDIGLDSRATEEMYDLEVMKLLKAMQSEVAMFWANSKNQFLKVTKAHGPDFKYAFKMFVRDKFDVDMAKQITHKRSYLEGTIWPMVNELADGIIGYFDNPVTFHTADKMTTFQEISNIADRPLWPGFETEAQYKTFLQTQTVTLRDSFPGTMNKALGPDLSWQRLCEEFIFIVLQLSMRKVDDSELSMARASSGQSVAAGPEEITQKMALHRLQMLGQPAGVAFKKRFLSIYMRDVKRGAKTWMEHRAANILDASKAVDFDTLDIGGLNIQDWLVSLFEEHAVTKCDILLADLKKKFEELIPFDFTTLNGRLPMATMKIQKQDFKGKYVEDTGGGDGFEVVKEEVSEQDAKELWIQPLRSRWPAITEKMFVEKDDRGLNLQKDTNLVAINVLQMGGSGSLLRMVGAQGDDERPNGDQKYAGWGFQTAALRVFKAVFVNTIDYCRPKLKAMMAEVYQEKSLRLQLQNKLDYKGVYDGILVKKRAELDETKAQQQMLMEAIYRVENNQDAGSVPIDDKEQLRCMQKKAQEAEAKAQKRVSMIAELKLLRKVQDMRHSSVDEDFTKVKEQYAKYVALDDLSELFSLRIDSIELREFQRPKDRVFFLGYWFRQLGWDGKDVEFIKPPSTILPHMRLFETRCVDVMNSFRATQKELNPDLVTETYVPYATFELPKFWPLHEYWLGIQVVLFGAKKNTDLFHVCIPLSYVLKDEAALWENVKGSSGFTIDATKEVPFGMQKISPTQVKFTFQQRAGHYEDYSRNVEPIIAGTALEVTMTAAPRRRG